MVVSLMNMVRQLLHREWVHFGCVAKKIMDQKIHTIYPAVYNLLKKCEALLDKTKLYDQFAANQEKFLDSSAGTEIQALRMTLRTTTEELKTLLAQFQIHVQALCYAYAFVKLGLVDEVSIRATEYLQQQKKRLMLENIIRGCTVSSQDLRLLL